MSSKNKKKPTLADKKQNSIAKIKPSEVDEFIEALPDDTRDALVERAIEVRQVQLEQYSYSGPIPHPELLRRFDEVIPNGADRIMTMSENQSAHRQEIEKAVVKANNRDSLLGIIFAGLIGLFGLIIGGFLILKGKEISGGLFAGGTLASLVGLYLKGTSIGSRDLEEKRKKN